MAARRQRSRGRRSHRLRQQAAVVSRFQTAEPPADHDRPFRLSRRVDTQRCRLSDGRRRRFDRNHLERSDRRIIRCEASGRRPFDGLSGLATTSTGRILYRTVENGTASIWIMDEDGKNRQQVTTEGVTSWPAPTPDGKNLVFVREGSGLWRTGIDGQNARPFANTPSALYPNVSPDGKWVFFTSIDTGSEKLWRVPFDGGDAVQVLDSRSGRPAVSPDGKQIAFFVGGLAVVMPIEGRTPTLTFPVFQTVQYSFVRWTRDGKALLHNTHRGDRPNIWLQPLPSGPERQVTHFADQNILNFDVSADGKRLIVARGILSRDALTVRNFR